VRLAELEPQFLRVGAARGSLAKVDTLAAAQGIRFLCPSCFQRNGGAAGTHQVLVWFADRDVPTEALPAPRWEASGAGPGDLTLRPSIDLSQGAPAGGCRWHGHVTAGQLS
jgi:hypothetical protein